MDSEYASEYRRLHQQHWWWRARQRAVLATLHRLNGTRPQRFLDIGCGDGLLFDELAKFGDVEGVEVDPSIVSDDNPWRDHIYVGEFDTRFQPDHRFTTILMLDVLEHLPDPRGALQHALSLLEPNGKMLITVPAFRLLWTTHDDLNHHYTRYTKRTFEELAAPLGEVREMRYLFHWLFAAKLAVRAKESLVRSHPRPPRVPPAPLNQTLYAVTRAEQTLLSPLPLPLGSSLMAVLAPAHKPDAA
jgi:2-polyprenyl-3-methyl-5-hydroxy-6-metoxy-1,4-benzoquinol methylase